MINFKNYLNNRSKECNEGACVVHLGLLAPTNGTTCAECLVRNRTAFSPVFVPPLGACVELFDSEAGCLYRRSCLLLSILHSTGLPLRSCGALGLRVCRYN
jgi:hypothetical protein